MNQETATFKRFSNNVFDRNLLSNKEYKEMIDNFITTVSLLTKEENRITCNEPQIINCMIEFGIIDSEEGFLEIKKQLSKEMFEKLQDSISIVINDNLLEYDEIAKYNKAYRVKIIEQEDQNKPTLVDLFCGAGGLSLGLTQIGFRVIFANDIEKSALRTYSFNHPEIDGKRITMGGIEDIAYNVNDYINESVDLIAGGPPCQGFSSANRQRIIDDPRNILYKYYVECVKRLNPKFFIMENVKGMKNVADQVVEDFNTNLQIGYEIDYEILNAKYLGIPQNRERLIYIGVREDVKRKHNICANKIFQLLKRSYKEKLNIMDAINSLKPLEASRAKNSTELGDEISGNKISSVNTKFENEYVSKINMDKKMNLTFNHKARYNNDRDIEIYSRMLPGDKSDSPRIADIMPYKSRSHMFKDKYYKLIPNIPCKTITAHMKFDCNMYIHPYQARGLTPREAARIQSYPDDYFFLGVYTKTYQQIGNSVPPLMARALGEEIIKYLQTETK
ncbi:DNA cytosine methyltransferase [Oceanobacillus sp. FSL W7-1293]|uniref:DNA cytosine methyltransferase n=1 Tax=unclassified Oceanobacillus TaxID=2630292 RepID=UPI0030CDD5E2